MQATLDTATQRPRQFLSAQLTYVETVVRQRSTQIAAGVFAFAALILLLSGRGQLALFGVFNVVGFLIFALATRTLAPAASDPPLAHAPKRHPAVLWIQLSLVALVVLLTGHQLFVSLGLLPANLSYIPLWTPLVNYLSLLATRMGPAVAPAYILAPALYFLLPAIVLPLFGAPWGELGFDEGHKAWRQASLWCFAPLAIFLLGITLASPAFAWKRLVTSTLAHGPFEEFLFRGALLTRILRVAGSNWALVGSSLVFAFWHAGQNIQSSGNLFIGLAAATVSYGVFGLALGLLFLRTRNLLAPSLLHIVALAAFL